MAGYKTHRERQSQRHRERQRQIQRQAEAERQRERERENVSEHEPVIAQSPQGYGIPKLTARPKQCQSIFVDQTIVTCILRKPLTPSDPSPSSHILLATEGKGYLKLHPDHLTPSASAFCRPTFCGWVTLHIWSLGLVHYQTRLRPVAAKNPFFGTVHCIDLASEVRR